MKPLLIFINGWGVKKKIFDSLIQLIEFDHDVHFIDPTDDLSLNEILLNDQPKIVITWSLGLAYYLELPYNTTNRLGLISISGSPCFINGDNQTLGWDLKIVERMIKKLITSPCDVMDDFMNNAVFQESKLLKSSALYHHSGLVLSDSLKRLSSIDVTSAVKSLDCDVLLIHGRDDYIVSDKNSHWLNANIKNSKLEIIDDCGHIPHIEAAGVTASHISKFYFKLRSRI